MGKFIDIPWVLLGDFNDISSNNEKFGGLPACQTKINCFNKFLKDSNLIYLGFEGPRFTWPNGRDHHVLVRTRIDRVHANKHWLTLLPNSKVFHLPRVKSDHCPILLKTNTHQHSNNKPFRLELFWINHPSFFNIVSNFWNTNNYCLDTIINDLKNIIIKWSKLTFENIHYKKKTLLKRLLGIKKSLSTSINPQLLLLEKQLQHEEQLWFSKSRINWLTLGDRNTYFFHINSVIRRRKNKILCLEFDYDTFTYNMETIKNNIFTISSKTPIATPSALHSQMLSRTLSLSTPFPNLTLLTITLLPQSPLKLKLKISSLSFIPSKLRILMALMHTSIKNPGFTLKMLFSTISKRILKISPFPFLGVRLSYVSFPNQPR